MTKYDCRDVRDEIWTNRLERVQVKYGPQWGAGYCGAGYRVLIIWVQGTYKTVYRVLIIWVQGTYRLGTGYSYSDY